MKTALYARVSTSDKGQDPEMQLRELREYCERRGWTITAEYVDVGVSGRILPVSTGKTSGESDLVAAVPGELLNQAKITGFFGFATMPVCVSMANY
jgi:hypothetical protein